MLNRKPTFLYHPPTNSTLVVPPYLPLPEGNFTREEGKGASFYLLVMDPQDYVKTIWREATQEILDFKWFVLNSLLTPQTKYLSNPDYVIRVEHFSWDCKEIGLEASLLVSTPPQKTLCLSSSAYVRRVFALDYKLGDYD